MRAESPFQPDDLAELEDLYERALQVVAMEDIADGNTDPRTLGVRHDVDNVISPAVQMAEWEADRGYRSTYFILHTAPYWHDKDTLRASLETIAECGHEIGFHVNALTAAIVHGQDPVQIVADAVGELRSYGHEIRGVVAHGDPLCHLHTYVNDEMFAESARPTYGAPDRLIGGRVRLRPVPRSMFGFEYDPNWLPRGDYLSDSGGRWSQPFERVAATYPSHGQLHLLVHPEWWSEAFAEVPACQMT